MVSFLKNLDMFGVSFSFNTFGQEKFKTKLGASMTCICLCIMGVFVYFFGTDFFHKENPNVIPNFLVHLETKKVPLKNEDLAFMFRLEDKYTNPINMSNSPYKLSGQYFHFRKNTKGVSEVMCVVSGPTIVKKCSKTKATLNPELRKVKLDEWFCWDMEAIKTQCRVQLKDKEPQYEPFLGGYMDEDELTALRYDVMNHEWDFAKNQPVNIVPDEEYTKVEWPSINVRYPAVSYDANSPDKPIITYYDAVYKVVSTNNYTRIFHFMSLVTNIDDSGWVFPNRTTTQTLELDTNDSESVAQQPTPNGAREFYLGFFMNVKKEKLYRRNFMKLQQLAALVGGMAKSVFYVFAFYTMLKAIIERDKELRRRFYKVKHDIKRIESELSLQPQASKVNTIVKNDESNPTDYQRLGWRDYLLSFCRKSEVEKANARIIELMNKHMYEKFDVAYLVKHFEEFSLIKQMLCTEEQKELLEADKKEIEVEA